MQAQVWLTHKTWLPNLRQQWETEQAKGVQQNAVAGKKGGKIAKDARLALENKTGRKVITDENFLPQSKQSKKIK